MKALWQQKHLSGLHKVRVGNGCNQHKPQRPCVKHKDQRHHNGVDAIKNAVGAGSANAVMLAGQLMFHTAPPYQML